jgi:uncharacterized protein (UPF0548 family)
MLTYPVSKTKDALTAFDLSSFFEGRVGFVISYLGIGAWIAWVVQSAFFGSGLASWLTVFTMAVIWIVVPLGLRLADQHGAGPLTRAIGLLRAIVLPVAAITLVALRDAPGFWSAVLTIPWLLFSCWAACVGIIRFLSRPSTTLDSYARDISLVALAAGSFCLTVSRAGITPRGLTEGRVGLVAACGMALVWLLPLLANRLTDAKMDWEPAVVHLARRTLRDLFNLRTRALDLAPTVETGLVNRALPPGYRWDEWSLPVDDFDNSCEALWNWVGHSEAGVVLNPVQPRIVEGETFVFAIPFGPLSVTGSCRITGIINERDVYGFVFSTLGHHAWSAEQSLVVTNIGGVPTVTATAIWAPTIVGSKLIPPLTRYLMGRYVNGILEGIAEAQLAEWHFRMQEIVDLVPVPKKYRVPVVDLEPEIVMEDPKAKTGSQLLADYENSWV